MKCLSLNGSLWNKGEKTVLKKCRVTSYKWRGDWIAFEGAAFEYVFSFEENEKLRDETTFIGKLFLEAQGAAAHKESTRVSCGLHCTLSSLSEHPLILRFLDAHLFPRTDPGERRYGVWLHTLMALFIILLLLVHTLCVPCSLTLCSINWNSWKLWFSQFMLIGISGQVFFSKKTFPSFLGAGGGWNQCQVPLYSRWQWKERGN